MWVGICSFLFKWILTTLRDNDHQCRAISIVVFGNPDQYEFVMPQYGGRPMSMLSGEDKVDVLCLYSSKRMEPDLVSGVTFSSPYFYGGFGFVGVPFFVDCADRLDSLSAECRQLRLCVAVGSGNDDVLQEILPGGVVVRCNSPVEVNQNLGSGECNVWATQPAAASEARFREAGYQGEFARGKNRFTIESVSLMTADGNPDWSSIVELVIHTFFLAEAHSITNSNAEDLRSILHPEDANSNVANSMVAIVSKFGNYAELYERHLQNVIPRRGLNKLYNHSDSSGLLYSLAFREVDMIGQGPTPNGTLSAILDRGYLRCGVHARQGFAEWRQNDWHGMDIEFCSGLAAAIFAGDYSAVEFVSLSEDEYHPLADGEIDVLAGQRVRLQGLLDGFVYGKAYFVEVEPMAEFALMTRGQDSQWASFVDWITMSIIYAEQEGIVQRSFVEMPITSLFGEELKQCLRDCLSAVGNYAEIYNRTLESILPRSGPNMPNVDKNSTGYGPQHFPISFY